MLDIDVKATWDALRKREDTDENFQITVDDKGPKVGRTRAEERVGCLTCCTVLLVDHCWIRRLPQA